MRVLLLTTAHSYRNEAFQQAADRLGIEVVLGVDTVSRLAHHWPNALALDFGAPAAAADAIAAFASAQPLVAVLAVDDAGVVVAALAAERLGLPHNSPAAAQAARDKHLMRQRFAAGGAPCPWFRCFSTAADPHALSAEVPYPCVLKPFHLNGSRGVIRADNPAAFVAAAQRLARLLVREHGPGDHQFLVEAFIPGFEVALEGMLDQGALTVLALFDKPDPLDGPFFEETLYVTPSRLAPALQAAIAAASAQAALALGLHSGPIHAELRVNAQGPWLLEVAGRSIGGLCGQTLKFELALSLEELILRQACGLPWDVNQPAAQASGVMMIPIPSAGILSGVDGVAAAGAVLGVEKVEITAPLLQTLTPLPEGDSYLGFIFARGESAVAVEAALRAAHRCLRFTVLPEFDLAAAISSAPPWPGALPASSLRAERPPPQRRTAPSAGA